MPSNALFPMRADGSKPSTFMAYVPSCPQHSITVEGTTPGILRRRSRPLKPTEGFQIAVLPRRHAAALQPGDAADVDPIPLEHVNRIPADLRVVVLNVAGLKQDHLAARRFDLPCTRRPFFKRRGGELRQPLV